MTVRTRNAMGRAVGVVVVTATMMAATAACGGPGGASAAGTVHISYYSYFNRTQVGPVIDGFEKAHPDIKIDVQYGQDPQQYVQTLQTRLAGGTPPTVFNLTMDNRTDVMNSGAAIDLAGGSYLKGLDPSNQTLFQYDGKTYGMAIAGWMGFMYYNKDILKKAGYDSFPKSWEDFIKMGEKINSYGSTAFLEDFNSQPAGSFAGLLASKYASEGDSAMDNDIWSGKSTFKKEWEPVFQAWCDAAKAGVIPKESVGLNADQVKQQFLTGSLAVMRSGTWDYADIKKSGINFGVAPFPSYGDDGENWINGGPDQGFAISTKATAKEQNAAKTFFSYLSSAQGLKQFTTAAGDLALSSNYTSSVPADYKSLYTNYFKKGKFYWINWAKAPTVMSTTDIAVQQQLVQGKITATKAAQELDSKWASVK